MAVDRDRTANGSVMTVVHKPATPRGVPPPGKPYLARVSKEFLVSPWGRPKNQVVTAEISELPEPISSFSQNTDPIQHHYRKSAGLAREDAPTAAGGRMSATTLAEPAPVYAAG